MGKGVFGFCAFCGKYKKLSREHFPPKGAFNSGEYKSTSINQYKTHRSLVWHEKWKSGGNAKYVTCSQCNNSTGDWYARDYNDFAYICQPYCRSFNAGAIEFINIKPFYPLRVVKQAVCNILASSDPTPDRKKDFTPVCSPRRADLGPPPGYLKNTSAAYAAVPALREFILDKNAKGLPKGVRLYFYILANLVGRSSGFISYANERTGSYAVFAEFAWPPLGWILLFDGEVNQPIREVTRWSEYEYNQQWLLNNISASCQWAVGEFLHFESPDEVAKIIARNQSGINGRG